MSTTTPTTTPLPAWRTIVDVSHRMPVRHQTLIDRFVAACQADARIVASFLGGSYASGTADEYSDVDLCLVTTDATYADFFANRAAFVRLLGEPVFFGDYTSYGFDLIQFMLPDGTEVEIGLGRESRFHHTHVGAYRVLVDKQDILTNAVFPERSADPAVQAETLRSLLCWFWHNVAHFVEDLGRGNVWSARVHLDELRLSCVQLARLDYNFAAQIDDFDKLERALPVATLAALEPTFCPFEPAAMLAAAVTIVQFYQHVAPGLAHTHGIAYPHAVDRIMSNRLERATVR